MQLAEAIDIVVANGLSFIICLERRLTNASILCKMSNQEGNEGY